MQEQEMSELLVVAIFGHEHMTRFMQDADLFESFKIVAKPFQIKLVLKPDCTKIQALGSLRDLLEGIGQRVAAVFVPNDPEGAWRDEKILSISDGSKWCTLDACLSAYDFVQSEPLDAIPA
jgi:hypothetical protein